MNATGSTCECEVEPIVDQHARVPVDGIDDASDESNEISIVEISLANLNQVDAVPSRRSR